MEAQPKQKLYKTAYSPMYGVYVGIDRAHQDDDGVWIYTCHSTYVTTASFNDMLFRETELSQFCL
jgi:hypothetical protein